MYSRPPGIASVFFQKLDFFSGFLGFGVISMTYALRAAQQTLHSPQRHEVALNSGQLWWAPERRFEQAAGSAASHNRLAQIWQAIHKCCLQELSIGSLQP